MEILIGNFGKNVNKGSKLPVQKFAPNLLLSVEMSAKKTLSPMLNIITANAKRLGKFLTVAIE